MRFRQPAWFFEAFGLIKRGQTSFTIKLDNFFAYVCYDQGRVQCSKAG